VSLPIVASANRLVGMDTPLPDPVKLLAKWDEWERGETAPGRVLADLKIAGLPELLKALAKS
jgi:hypothetical protein